MKLSLMAFFLLFDRGELLSGGMRGVGMPYGPRWRNWRAVSILLRNPRQVVGFCFFIDECGVVDACGVVY